MGGKDDILKFETREDLDREAAEWFARQDIRDLGSEEQAELDAWLAVSANRRAAYERAKELWRDLDGLADLCAEPIEVRRPDPAAPRPVVKVAAIAACLMVMLSLAAMFVSQPGPEKGPARYVTAIGDQRTIALSDGSSIVLNTNSDLEVLFDDRVRLIKLHRGEAYFEVAKDQKRRFRVDAGDNAVVAVGTAFVVRRKVGAVDVAVTHGVVELQQAVSRLPEGDPSGVGTDTSVNGRAADSQTDRVWTPVAAMVVGQSATIPDNGGGIIRNNIGDVDRMLDWTDGSLVFQGEPLSDVVQAISRYSGYRFEIEDSELNALRIGGVFKVGDVTGLVEALEASFGVRAQYIGEAEIKLSRASGES